MRKIYLSLVVSVLGLMTIWWVAKPKPLQTGFVSLAKLDDEDEEEHESEEQDGILEAQQQDFNSTKDLRLGYIPRERLVAASEALATARKTMRLNNAQRKAALTWTERGPNTDAIGVSNGNYRGPNSSVTSGRIRAIWVDLADATKKTVWVGGVAGGLWKTTDVTASPATWLPVDDFLDNMSIGSICQNPSNPNIMYFGTGEKAYNLDAVRGGGVWKSTNHGVSWSLLPSTTGFWNVSKMLCDAAGNIYVATIGNNAGIRRSTDGGTTWTDITPTGLSSNVTEMELSSTGRLHIVCGYWEGSALNTGYRFTAAPASVTTATWTSPTTPFTSTQYNVEMAIAGDILYALPANAAWQTPIIWKSIDGGDNWNQCVTNPTTTSSNSTLNLSSGQGWYCLAIGVDPANANNVVVGGLNTFRSTNGGDTWTQVAAWVGTAQQYVHADQHAIVYAGDKVLIGSDGGIFYSADGGVNWEDRNAGLRIKQFYSCAIHPSMTNYFIAGAQDNGMHQFNTPGLGGSTEFIGGDGMFAHIDQDEPQYQFGSYVYNTFRRSTDGGATWSTVTYGSNVGQFVNPSDYDDANNKMYSAGSSGQYIRWENPQVGNNFTAVAISAFNSAQVSHVMVSPNTSNRVFFGTTSGRIVRVDNAEQAAPSATNITGSAMSGGNVSCVAVGADDNHLLATFSNYGSTHVWMSTTGGGAAGWTNVSGNLPDVPVRWAMFYPYDDTKAIIATEAGVFETANINGAATMWTQSTSLPIVRTDMLQFRPSDNTIIAATHGRGLWTATVPAAAPYVQFANAYIAAGETNPVVNGCRKYKDYTVSMTIAKAPAGAATATISVVAGGTAAQGSDFDFTTNGNFAVPSNTVTFANGATTPQTITIRVYDDGKVEGTESFTINYTLSGATNAVVGPSRQSFTFAISDNDVAPVNGATSLFTIGQTTYSLGNSTAGQPFDAKLQSKKTRMLYLASELTAKGMTAGPVSSIAFNILSKNSTRPYTNFQINMGTTTTDYLYQPSPVAYNNVTLSNVKSLGSYSTNEGWNTFTLDNPITWDGASNIVVEICYDNGTADANDLADVTYGYSDATTNGTMIWANNLACGTAFSTFSFYNNGVKPMIQFAGGSGTPIESDLNSNTSQYVDDNGMYYFFSSGSIMSQVSSASANLGCVSSTVSAAGNTWQVFDKGKRSQKVFTITPTTNGASATYTVGLYFTTAELEGKDPNSLRIAKTTAATIAAADKTNTIAKPSTVTPFGSGYLFTASFTGFSQFFLVDNAVTLPVNLLVFGGKVENATGKLQWSTATEQNAKNFEVQKSVDGINYATIGTVTAAGNSASRKDYAYNDDKLSQQNYYRLKMNDRDGNNKLSNVVLLQYNEASQKLWVLSNPFANYIDLRVAKEAKQLRLQLVSSNGAVVAEKELANVSGQVRWQLGKELGSGSYILRSVVDGTVYTNKLVKQ